MSETELELQVLPSLPEGFLECGSRDLYKVLGGPTLIHLPGNQPGPPVFICTLLHGNETTGFEALQDILMHYGGRPPRPVSIFIGNVSAARYGERFLPGQPDYNRIWTGGQSHEYQGHEVMIARQVLELMKELDVCACIDIHNNTGRNPHYAIIATRETPHLALARRFSDRVVYATYPDTSCSVAFSP
jgi:succinylglutamate desuccinylase